MAKNWKVGIVKDSSQPMLSFRTMRQMVAAGARVTFPLADRTHPLCE